MNVLRVHPGYFEEVSRLPGLEVYRDSDSLIVVTESAEPLELPAGAILHGGPLKVESENPDTLLIHHSCFDDVLQIMTIQRIKEFGCTIETWLLPYIAITATRENIALLKGILPSYMHLKPEVTQPPARPKRIRAPRAMSEV